MMSKTAILALAAIASMSGVMAHSKALLVTGDNGVAMPGFANDPAACLGPERRCQQDTIIFEKVRNRRGLLGLWDRQRGAPATSAAPGCGETRGSGVVTCATELAKAEATGQLPSCSTTGTVAMTMHQLNGDGAGPFAMFVNADGTGNTWTAMTVTTQVPGSRGRSDSEATDFPLVGQMPAGTKCTGGADGQTCLVQAQNPVGPFGGVVAVTQAQAPAAAAIAPAAVAPAAIAPATVAPAVAAPAAVIPAAGTVAETAPAATIVQAAPVPASVVQAAPLAVSVVQAPPAIATVAQAATIVQAAPVPASVVQAAPLAVSVVQAPPAIATVAQAAPLAIDPLTAASTDSIAPVAVVAGSAVAPAAIPAATIGATNAQVAAAQPDVIDGADAAAVPQALAAQLGDIPVVGGILEGLARRTPGSGSGSGWTELSIAGRKRAYRRRVAAEEDACDDAETGDAYC